MSNNLTVDIAIIGGGIAGLWTAARLKQSGFNPLLIESNQLGGSQTVHSQGIIHGGMKYALSGFLNKASESIKAMPHVWSEALKGHGPLDLSGVKQLSPHQYLWSNQTLSHRISSFFASFALKSRVQSVPRSAYPLALQSDSFKGNCYQLDEMVLNVPSLIEALALKLQANVLKVDPFDAKAISLDEKGAIQGLKLTSNQTDLTIQAKAYLLTAGEGNQMLAKQLFQPPAMQVRPLHMVAATLKQDISFYAHLIETDATPRLTITTHPNSNGQTTWYLGGKLAEQGVDRNEVEQIAAAKQELQLALPHLDFSKAQWKTHRVNRAEGLQRHGKRPDLPVIEKRHNAWIAWPTKLAFSPLLADNLLKAIQQDNILPSEQAVDLSLFEKPSVAQPFWEKNE